jgi:hypothetical protein
MHLFGCKAFRVGHTKDMSAARSLPVFTDYTTLSLVEVRGIKRTAIKHSGMWYVRHIDGGTVFVARDAHVGQSEWIEVDCDRIIFVMRH